jgi:hypothetical protein
VDSYRITATGGPTTPGAPDVGTLTDAWSNGYVTAVGLTMGPGDATVSTQWQPVALTSYPFVPRGNQPVTWRFSTFGCPSCLPPPSEENSYDLASMTVEYRYYLPVP